jgi:hypothetical protein
MKNIFWNIKNSFVGIPFIRTGVEALTVSITAVSLGYYVINKTLFDTKKVYYDMYD